MSLLQIPHTAPIRIPNASSSMIYELQTLQNSALHVATRCVQMTSIDHLPEETKVLLVHDHLSLFPISLSRTLQFIKASQNVVTWKLSETWKTPFKTASSKIDIKFLYIVTIFQCIYFLAQSDFLSANINRKSKPRSLLHDFPFPASSSFWSSLLSYRRRIGLMPSPLFPSWGGKPHTSIHLSSCPLHPTSFTAKDQWVRPCLTSKFLFSFPLFDLPPPLYLLPLSIKPFLFDCA